MLTFFREPAGPLLVLVNVLGLALCALLPVLGRG